MIQIREYTPEDYPMLSSWWRGHGWDPVPSVILPKLGMIAEIHKDGQAPKPVAAAWLYLDNSVFVGMLEWIVTDPENAPKISALGISHVTQCLRAAAKDMGYRVFLASCRQESLSRLLQRVGFTETDKDVIHLIAIEPD